MAGVRALGRLTWARIGRVLRANAREALAGCKGAGAYLPYGANAKGLATDAQGAAASTKLADDLVKYARYCQSPSAAMETLDHGESLLEASPEGQIRVALAAAEIAQVDLRDDLVEKYCTKALETISTVHEDLNVKFQIEASLLARHMLTTSYIGLGRDDLVDDLTCGYADLDLSLVMNKRDRKVLTAILEGMKGRVDHSIGAMDLAEVNWEVVKELMGGDTASWDDDHRLNHVMKDFTTFMDCRGHANASHYDEVIRRAEVGESQLESAFGLWDSPLAQRELMLDAKFAQAQALIKQGQLEEAEAQLERLLQDLGDSSKDSDPRIALTIMKLADIYSASHRLTLAEGLYRNAEKLLAIEGNTPFHGKDSGVKRQGDPIVLALLEHSYSMLLAKIPKRESEAQAMQSKAHAHWMECAGLQSSPIGDIAKTSVIDLRCRKVYYCPSKN
mmetsp:Transcript_3924/g.10025  ORF Transcript_3924/g.10025 Transcript_3924/m.10025 type:complete len:447 (-) Transcript_3924:879-2219(-)